MTNETDYSPHKRAKGKNRNRSRNKKNNQASVAAVAVTEDELKKTQENLNFDKEALKIHGLCFEDESESDSGKSSLDEEFYRYLPPPLQIDVNQLVVIEKKQQFNQKTRIYTNANKVLNGSNVNRKNGRKTTAKKEQAKQNYSTSLVERFKGPNITKKPTEIKQHNITESGASSKNVSPVVREPLVAPTVPRGWISMPAQSSGNHSSSKSGQTFKSSTLTEIESKEIPYSRSETLNKTPKGIKQNPIDSTAPSVALAKPRTFSRLVIPSEPQSYVSPSEPQSYVSPSEPQSYISPSSDGIAGGAGDGPRHFKRNQNSVSRQLSSINAETSVQSSTDMNDDNGSSVCLVCDDKKDNFWTRFFCCLCCLC